MSENETLRKNGAYLFQFYRLGEWNKVLIDEQLPLKIFKKKLASGKFRRGGTFEPQEVEDYWALLLEKAFAKFVGGYMQLEGGFPRCAVTHLSGGITTCDDIEDEITAKTVSLLKTNDRATVIKFMDRKTALEFLAINLN